jgi:TPR repeat protein
MHLEGQGVAVDDAQAADLLQQAADRGHAVAARELGYLLLQGKGRAKNAMLAAAYLRRAAAGGDMDAQYTLAGLFVEGVGVVPDPKQAARWFAEAAANGHLGAQVEYGIILFNGRGVPKDEHAAADWFLAAASEDNPSARFWRIGSRGSTPPRAKPPPQALKAGRQRAAIACRRPRRTRTWTMRRSRNNPRRDHPEQAALSGRRSAIALFLLIQARFAGDMTFTMLAVLPKFRRVLLCASVAIVLVACRTQLANVPVQSDPEAGSATNIESLTAVIARDPNNPESYNVRGSAYGRAGQYREAIADFNQAIALNPNFARAYANRALIHRRNGDTNAALEDYNRAIQGDPRYAPAYVGRGNIYRQDGRLDLALADYNAAIQIDRTDAQAFHNRGLAYQAQGQHQRAIPTTHAVSATSRSATPVPRSTTSTKR